MSAVHVVGAGGHAKVVISTLRAAGYTVAAAYDDNAARWGDIVSGVPIVGGIAQLAALPDAPAILAIGANAVRRRIAAQLPHVRWVTAVHPSAVVDSSARLGAGAAVFAQAVIQPDAVIGAHAIVNTAATVDHDNVLGDYAQIAPGAHLSGGVRLEDGVFLGTNGAVNPGVTIGAWTIVGAGAVVIRDLPAHVTAVGVPARIIKARNEKDE